ncbi:Wzz/FepE/Etk N-terminal domain-containing protein [Alcaligenes sp. WGS1538]|uniref:Wzz/FepE/Etk N-terminal domain-containing protein n=1 Tax=Alcaligenes sp. WGS1538 TaxID=3366811 RepID=UPI00372D4FD4
MTSPPAHTPSARPAPTFFDVLGALRHNKLPILLLTLLGMLAAIVYIAVTEPRFRARSEVIPPTPADLANFNTAIRTLGPAINEVVSGALDQNNLVELTPETAFRIFVRHLNSQNNLDEFFETVYLPHQSPSPSVQDRELLRLRLSKDLTILNVDRDGVPASIVTLSHADPKLAQEWTNRFVDMALQSSREEVLHTLQSTASLRTEITDAQIASLRKSAEADRLAQITRVRDAYELAQQIQLEQPSNTGNLITSYSGDNLYLRGAKALKAELDILESRKDNDPYIKALPALLTKRNLLSSVDIAHLSGKLATIDLRAIQPATPYQPRKLVALAIGLAAGLVLALLFVLTRLSFQFHQRNLDRSL